MKVLLSGYHNPNFVNTMVYRDKAVKDLGHELISFEDRAFMLPGRLRERVQFLQRWDLQRLNDNLVRSVMHDKPEVCIVVGGQRVLPETVRKIRDAGCKIGLWTTDVPSDFDNILTAAPHYDHLFCAGSEAVDIFWAEGFRKVTWVPFGCDPHYHKNVVLNEEEKGRYQKDVVFVGSYYPNRVRLLETIADLDIAIWGPNWSEAPQHLATKGKVHDVKINYEEWVKIYNAAKIVLVVHYQDKDVPCHQASPKLFEAMACGSFVLSDSQKDPLTLFQDRRQVVFFKNPDDLRRQIEYYLRHEVERKAIAQAGQKEVRQRHTYKDRIAKILSILTSA